MVLEQPPLVRRPTRRSIKKKKKKHLKHRRKRHKRRPLGFTGARDRRPRSWSLTRQAIRDCSDHSSMNPGEAAWENRPPDSAKLASCGS